MADQPSGEALQQPLDGRLRFIIAACWIQVAVAALLFGVSLVADHRAPLTGMDWREDSGLVLAVEPDQPADEAGIRPGDRIISVNDLTSASGLPLFYQSAPGVPLDVIVERGGTLEFTRLTPESKLTGRERNAGGPAGLMLGIANQLRVAVNLWFLGLAVLILTLRPRLASARVASLAVAYWVGGNSLISVTGFGTLFATLSPTSLFFLHLVDLTYSLLFLAFMVHFAMLFPRPFPALRNSPALQVIPYAVVVPLIAISAINLVRFFFPSLRSAFTSVQSKYIFDLFGPLILTAEAFLLTQQYRYTTTRNDRRRLTLVLASLFPGLAAWMFYILLQYINASLAARAFGRVLFWTGASASAAIFAWAVLRHKVFGVDTWIRRGYWLLARSLYFSITALPAIVLFVFLFVHRNESISRILSENFLVVAGLVAPTLILYRYRERLLESIDRRFFREEYDAHKALGRLASMIQRGTDITFQGRLALTEIEKALHPEHSSFWRLDRESGSFRSVLAVGAETLRPAIHSDHALSRYLARRPEPLQVDMIHPSNPLKKLSTEADIWIWLGATGADLIVPLIVDNEVLGFLLLGPRLSEEPYSQSDRDLLQAVAAQLALTEDYVRLEGLARYDPLTEALNRHAFYSLIDRPDGAKERPQTGCVAVVDLNDLKTINDTLGHGAGDIAIRHVASTVRKVVRADDLVFRWGGDEFLAILFGLPEAATRERLGMMDALFEASGIRDTIPLSVAFGVAAFTDSSGIQEAIEMADREMYYEKHKSRTAAKSLDSPAPRRPA